MIRLLLLVVAIAVPGILRAETDIIEVTSPGGIKAWLVREESIPILALDIHFAGGGVLDPDDKAGATSLMIGLLEEGSGDMDSVAFAEAGQALAARFGFSAGKEGVSLSAMMLTENRDATVDLIGQALNDPTFPEEAITRVRAQLISSIRSQMKEPSTIAGREFIRLTLPDHPYARPLDGTVETVTGLTKDDLIAAHARAFTRRDMTIGAVGAITPQELGLLLDRLLGELPATGPGLPPPADPVQEGAVAVIPFESPQAVAVFGHAGIARDDPDFIAAFVVNQVLGGGGFGARLSEELRERRGLTYGVNTYLDSGPTANLLIGSVSSANATMPEAIEAIRAEWSYMADTGLTALELDTVKKYLTGSYALRFDGNRKVASLLVRTQMDGLPASYISKRNELIEALTLEEVNRVAAELLDPEMLRFVVVGQPETMEAAQ